MTADSASRFSCKLHKTTKQVSVSDQSTAAYIWFRRDLRLDDNGAISAALGDGIANLIPLFVLDARLWNSSGDARRSYLARSLRDLDAQLDGKLLVVRGAPTDVLATIGSRAPVYCSQDFGPFGMRRDADVIKQGVDLRFADSPYAVNPGSVFNLSGNPYKVFTPYSKAWAAHGWEQSYPCPPPSVWQRESDDAFAPFMCAIPDDPLPEMATLPTAIATQIADQVEVFLTQRVGDYRDNRNVPSIDGTSRLSTALKYGRIHPRTLLSRLGNSDGETVFRSELCWREFYADVLFNFPASAAHDLNPIEGLTYDVGAQADMRFEAWCNGQTGYPIVDAGMRQLLQEGWMHNRVRMIVASFLAKDLHLWWKRGADWFMKHLVDGDLASNTHGWQWTAGTGTDASPYFRVFNPTTQGQRFDPNGDYIRRYVPELAHLDARQIHEPWLEPKQRKGASLFEPATLDYPKPIVDHGVERDEALARYKARK